MPVWVQIVLTSAALVAAGGTLWAKFLKPGAKVVSEFDRMLPVVKEVVDQFHGDLRAFAILRSIAKEFRPDHGSSLRDVVNRLEAGVADAAASSARCLTAVEMLASEVSELRKERHG